MFNGCLYHSSLKFKLLNFFNFYIILCMYEDKSTVNRALSIANFEIKVI